MPFRNLKFLIILNKALGIVSCKLVNGQLKSSSTWSCRFCIIWVLFHCSYTGMYLYNTYITLPDENNEKDYALDIVRIVAFLISLFPYYFAAAFWSQDFVNLSDKLLTYDELVMALGHRRKDKHIFTYLYFIYTYVTINWKCFNNISSIISQETIEISSLLQVVIPPIVGAYCIFITCIFLDLIRQRFRHLNEIIIPHVSELPVTGSQDEITVYDIRYLHGALLYSAELINTLYGTGALFTFISIFVEFVGTIYSFIKDLQENKHLQATYAWLLDLSFQTFYFFAMYHFTTYEANRVEERVIKYGLSFSNKKCRMDKIEMMLYFYHRRYSFTAAGFFPINMTIILPIATAVITYLTLIV